MPKISVIVPIFGVEKFIGRCVDSLFCQTLSDIEFIFVDDCTIDRSIDILKDKIEEYKKCDASRNSIKLIKMPQNSGLHKVREYGMRYAKGDYVLHCDSDDWLEPEMCSMMYNKAIEDNSDIVICDFTVSDGVRQLKKVCGCRTLDKQEFISKLLYRKDPWSIWNKLFKRVTCYGSNIIPPKGAMGEDMVLTMQLLLNGGKISYLDKPLYNYYYNPNSISHAPSLDKKLVNFLNNKDNVDIIIEVFRKKCLISRYEKELFNLKWQTKCLLWDMPYDIQRRELWLKTYQEINRGVLFSSNISFEQKIKFILSYLRLYPRKANYQPTNS